MASIAAKKLTKQASQKDSDEASDNAFVSFMLSAVKTAQAAGAPSGPLAALKPKDAEDEDWNEACSCLQQAAKAGASLPSILRKINGKDQAAAMSDALFNLADSYHDVGTEHEVEALIDWAASQLSSSRFRGSLGWKKPDTVPDSAWRDFTNSLDEVYKTDSDEADEAADTDSDVEDEVEETYGFIADSIEDDNVDDICDRLRFLAAYPATKKYKKQFNAACAAIEPFEETSS